MSTIALIGAGAVGVRAARQLVDTAGLDRLIVANRDHEQAQRLARAVGGDSVPVDRVLDEALDAVALAVPGAFGTDLGRRAVERGIPLASCADDPASIAGLTSLGALAFDRGVSVAVGCGLSPGISDVLARHAADALDDPDEVQVARIGTAGPSCATSLRQAMRADAREWHDGGWQIPHRQGSQLVWFPEPIGARECEVIEGGISLVHSTVPEARDAAVRAEAPPRWTPRWSRQRGPGSDDFGGARIEVFGWRGGSRTSIVYGLIERPAVAAGTALAVTAARFSGLLPSVALRADDGGVRALGATFEPPAFLAELAHRGVKVAAFEGSNA